MHSEDSFVCINGGLNESWLSCAEDLEEMRHSLYEVHKQANLSIVAVM